MREGSKTLVAALVALLLATALVACGGDDSDSSTTESASQGQASDQLDDSAASNGGVNDGGSDKSGTGGSSGGPGSGGDGGSGSFTPEQHDDSGGGSGQFQVKGGDNSVQEFGEEADAEEFDAAARVLHDFLDARAQGEWAAACDNLASQIITSLEKFASKAKGFGPTDCASILAKLTNPAAKEALLEEAKQADVGSLRIEDGSAFVIYRAADNTIMAMSMTQEGGDWKVATLAGTPLS